MKKKQFGSCWLYSCQTLGIAIFLLLCDRDQSPAAVLFLEERWSDHQPRNAFQPFQFYKPELFNGTLTHTVPGQGALFFSSKNRVFSKTNIRDLSFSRNENVVFIEKREVFFLKDSICYKNL